jgi:hypothetical protein
MHCPECRSVPEVKNRGAYSGLGTRQIHGHSTFNVASYTTSTETCTAGTCTLLSIRDCEQRRMPE